MRKYLWLALLLLPCLVRGGGDGDFKGVFRNEENDVALHLNLYDTVLVVPRFDFLGKMNGYMEGDIHEIWFVTSFSIKNGTAVLNLSNEMGSESQRIMFSRMDSVHYKYEVNGTNAIRKIVNRKWVKLPPVMLFERMAQDSSRRMKPVSRGAYRKY